MNGKSSRPKEQSQLPCWDQTRLIDLMAQSDRCGVSETKMITEASSVLWMTTYHGAPENPQSILTKRPVPELFYLLLPSLTTSTLGSLMLMLNVPNQEEWCWFSDLEQWSQSLTSPARSWSHVCRENCETSNAYSAMSLIQVRPRL